MRYYALAVDYDGTIATHGKVDETTLAALERLRDSGRKLILVTGRILNDLLSVFSRIDLFERLVLENGAVLYRPATHEEHLLAESPPSIFAKTLQDRGVAPLGQGSVIVATWEPHETTVLKTIHELGLELQVIFNKGAVMVLPSAVNKATGLAAALKELHLSPHNTVGAGDAENDHAFLNLCECSVAVSNALPFIKERADWITASDRGRGVTEVINRLIENDLRDLKLRENRHHIPLGIDANNQTVTVPPYGTNLLLAGTSGSGKSTFASAFLEQLAEQSYQFCIIDPEGDYESFTQAVALGDSKQTPSVEEVVELLDKSGENLVVNLLGVALVHRPAFFENLFSALFALRARTGRPHWIIIDEAHHLLPSTWAPIESNHPAYLYSIMLITVHPDHVSPTILAAMDMLITIGESPQRTIANFCKAIGQTMPDLNTLQLVPGEAIGWQQHEKQAPFWFRSNQPRAEHRRHRRKYIEGELGPDKSFFFRGAHGQFKLRAQNLLAFIQMAEGIDDETWEFHLHRGDYAQWFRNSIKDEQLAQDTNTIASLTLSPKESRSLMKQKIKEAYTLPV